MPSTLKLYHLCGSVRIDRINNQKRMKAIVEYACIVLVILCLNIRTIEAKETVLVQSLETKNDKILMRLLEQTHNYIQFERFVSSLRFQCKAILKNELTKNVPDSITKISLQLDFGQVMSISLKESLPGFQAEELQLTKRVDKLLDVLNGQCLYYTTSTFIYEYCHKEHVRQYDSDYTRVYNVKAEYQDISMGTYNPDQYNNKKIRRRGVRELTEEERKVTLPEPSDFSKDYNFLMIDDIDNKNGKMELQESDDGNLLYANIHLVLSDSYYIQSPIFLKLICGLQEQSYNFKEVINYGMLVDPYTLVYTNKQGRCDRYDSHIVISQEIKYLGDSNPQPLRVYGRYLYGNVEEICTLKWAWQKSKYSLQFGNDFQEGSLLFIELYNQKDKQIEYHYVTVKKIISSQLIELEAPLGKSFKELQNSHVYLNYSTILSNRLVANITKCQLLFKKQLNLNSKLDLSYSGNGIFKLNHKSTIDAGDNFGCICKSVVQNNLKIIDFDIVISKKLWSDYYKAFAKSNTYIYESQSYEGKQYILLQCQDYTCFRFVKQDEDQAHKVQVTDRKRFTQIVKLSSKVSDYMFKSSNQQHFYILTIKNNGIFKLVTRARNGMIYTYLLTEGQIIKTIQFINGTKEIIKENKYYQNSTKPEGKLHGNYIFIKISRLPNGSYFGGIWKVHDYIYFPRFLLFDEQLISLQRTSGYAYLRILNLQNLRKKQSMAVVRYMKQLQQYYLMKEQQTQNPNNNVFLDKSYSISYNYVSGKYCQKPINKFRQTSVELKCGNSWFKITKLLETSPCVYSIQIETTLLCREGYKYVLEQDDNLFNKGSEDRVINNGILCYPSLGLFNEISPYLYIRQSLT